MKLFISQPRKGKSNEELRQVRDEAIDEVRNMFGEDIEVIDSFIQSPPDGAKPIWYFAKSVLLMSKADVVYFAKGWRDARGCVLENAIAIAYDMCCIQTS